ncbi:MAG: DUF1284 domain-containing protein [Caldanaerobacter subterraneus]|nr:DUF1284 domain-containing protein [Caldanaerobacter subterraneus]
MEIRGHHFLCMLGFRGLGYDEEFVKNMNEIIERLYNEQYMLIKVVDNVDNICSTCPNNVNGECTAEKYPGSVREKDRAILKILGIEVGEAVWYKDVGEEDRE